MTRRLAEEAIELDPNFAAAYSLLSRSLWRSLRFRYAEDPAKTKQDALNTQLKAVELEYSANTLSFLGLLYYQMMKEREKGLEIAEKALALNPHNSSVLNILGLLNYWSGRCKEAISLIEKAIRVSPRPSANNLMSGAQAYCECQLYDECITLAQKAVEISPDSFPSHRTLTVCYALSGRIEEAKASAAEVLRIRPDYKAIDNTNKYRENRKEAAARWHKAEIMAGMPTE